MRTKKSASEVKTADPRTIPTEIKSEVQVDMPEQDISRLAIPMDANGNVLWEMMRSKTKDKLKVILSNPETAKILQVESPAGPVVEIFDAKWMNPVFDGLGKFEAFLAVKMYKISSEVADKAFAYNEAEKNILGPPAARVINKYAPIWMEKFKDEIALAFLFVTITATKLQFAVALQASMVPAREAPQPRKSEIDPSTLERSVGESGSPS